MRNKYLAAFRFSISLGLLGTSVHAQETTLATGLNVKKTEGVISSVGDPSNLKEITENCKSSPEQLYCKLQCQYREVICVFTTGAPIPSEVIPDTLDPRTTITVNVIKPVADSASLVGVRFTEVINKDPSEKATTGPTNATTDWRDIGSWRVWTTLSTMTTDAESERIDFFADKTAAAKLSSFIVRSNGGRYFYSFGPMLVIPWHGVQKVGSYQPPDGGGERLSRTQDTDFLPAFAVHLYPGGHRAQSSSPFERINFWNFVRDAFSVEAAVSIKPSEIFDHVFAGAAFEPITGFTASMGVGIHRAERYRNGYQDGAFPPSSRNAAVEEFAQVGGYAGFAVNQKIYETIVNAFSSHSAAQQAGPQ